MRKRQKTVCKALNYIEHFLILLCAIAGGISTFAFASFLGFPIGITGSVIGLTISVAIKKYKSIIKKNDTTRQKKHKKIVLLANSKLNRIEVLVSKLLIDSDISYYELSLINNILKEYDNMKEKRRN